MPAEDTAESLRGLRIVIFESRRSAEMAEMIQRRGGEPIRAPSMREVPLEENEAALEFARRLREGKLDVVVFLTGVGTRFLAESVSTVLPKEALAAALRSIVTVARGPKPVAALREIGLAPSVTVPEPNTWRELLAALDAAVDLRGKRVAVQEYGEENPDLVAGLAERGAEVMRVPVYKWALPSDLAPLRDAIRRIAGGEADIAIFTSATQVEHLFAVAGDEHARALLDGFRRVVVASIGPICSRALEKRGLAVDFEPEHPKMGFLLSGLSERGRALVEEKRRI